MTTSLSNLRYAFRMLAKQPMISLLAIVALGLGIGLTTAMYSIIQGALADLPFDEGHRIVHIEGANPSQGDDSIEMEPLDFLEYQRQQTSFETFGAYYSGTMNLTARGERPERYSGGFMTADSFRVLRVAPILGRDFEAADTVPGAPAVVMLSHDLWQSRFGGDDAILGRTVRVNSIERTVIGVMPPKFAFPGNERLWLPHAIDPTKEPRGQSRTLEVFARLRNGVSLKQARSEMKAIAARLEQSFPDTNKGLISVVKPYTEEAIPTQARVLLFVMLAAVFGVLVIACFNVANLLLSRALTRGKEVAVRTALGSSRRAVIFQFLTETLLLSFGGMMLGLLLAYWGIHLFNRAIVVSEPPFWLDIRIDGWVLLFTVGLTLAASLIAGLLPALRASGKNTSEILKDESRGSSSLRVGRLSRGLVTAEIALSCGLAVAAGLATKSVLQLNNKAWGVPTKDVFLGRVALFEQDYPEPAARYRLFEEVEGRVAALPGVRSVATADTLPVAGTGGNRVQIEGKDYPKLEDVPFSHEAVVSPSFFDLFETRVSAGRAFSSADRDGNLPVAIVNQAFVKRFLGDKDPIGQRLRAGGLDTKEPWRTIVGVVPDLYMDGIDNEEPWGYYVPVAQSDRRFIWIIARTQGPPLAIADEVRDVVAAVDSNLPVYFLNTLEGNLQQEGWAFRVFGVLFMIFGAVALLLTAVGLYGVMSSSVERRRHEVGIRMALGARADQVVSMILRQGSWQLGVGLTIGLALAALLGWRMSFILFQVKPFDPVVFALIVVVLALTGLLACLLPARRASKVDPAIALGSG